MKVIEPYKNKCNYFLFDTKSKQYGGTGIKFNWEQLSDYDNEVPLFLSGGIAPGDTGILDQLKNLNIHAIDINSKFEAEPGIKNIDLIKSFLINLKS
jgi:phosphoribosylanthranilate isomerase